MVVNPSRPFIMSHYLKVYYQNVRGLKTKVREFRSELMSNSYDVVLLCETWLNEDYHTSELFDDRYIVYRNDRDNAALGKNDGGGCAIAVKKELFSARIADFELENDIWVSIEQAEGSKAYFNVKYIELGSNLEVYKKHFDKITENVMSSGVSDSFVLTGDYNLADNITWCCDSLTGEYFASNIRGSVANELLDVLALCDLNQLNVIRNAIGRTLDLFITSIQPNCVTVARSSDPLVPEDGHHPALDVKVNLARLKYLVEKRPPKVNFRKANYVRLGEDLMRIDWNRELIDLDVNTAVERFYSILDPLIETIPKIIFPSRDYPVYYSYELISKIKMKDKLRQKIKNEECPVAGANLKLEFSNLRKSVKMGIKTCFEDYVIDCEEKLKSNTKCFFAFTKSLKKTNSLPNSMRYLDEE